MKRLFLALLVLSIAHAATAADVPMEYNDFTRYVVGKLQPHSRHELHFWIPLYVYLTGSDRKIDLGPVWETCQANEPGCAAAVDAFVEDAVERQTLAPPPLAKSNLRAALFDVDDYLSKDELSGPGRVLERNLTDALIERCDTDPRTPNDPLLLPALQTLGMNEDGAFRACERNLREALGPMPEAYGSPADDGVIEVHGSRYEAARLLLTDQWSALAKRLGGRLLVAIPRDDVVIYSAGDKVSTKAFREHAMAIVCESEWPLSRSVFEFVDGRWVVKARLEMAFNDCGGG